MIFRNTFLSVNVTVVLLLPAQSEPATFRRFFRHGNAYCAARSDWNVAKFQNPFHHHQPPLQNSHAHKKIDSDSGTIGIFRQIIHRLLNNEKNIAPHIH